MAAPLKHSLRARRRPDFLVIGAYKSGTTSLFHELAAHPDIGVPAAKEVAHLVRPEVTHANGLARYEAYFHPLRHYPIVGEVAPQYTAAPRWTGVAARARDILGPDLKLIYIVRHPLDRIVSHLAHREAAAPELALGAQVPVGMFHEADISRYGMQIDPWLSAFPRANLLVVTFEAYRDDPASVRQALFTFLGAGDPPVKGPAVQANVTANRRRKPDWLKRFLRHHAYRAYLQPLLPVKIRQQAGQLISRQAYLKTGPAESMSETTRSVLHETLKPDIADFYTKLGRTGPLWADFPLKP